MIFRIIFLAALFIGYIFLSSIYWNKKIKEKTQLIREKEAQVIHMEKMASLGTLAAGIAHEINNPLSFLISNLQSLKNFVESPQSSSPLDKKQMSDQDFIAMTKESLEGALRIKKIVSDLRTFSRRSESQDIRVDINQVVESVLAIIWNEIKYKITVIKDYQAKSNISGDPTQLSQVFLNIILNASQAIAEKGTINLSTYEDEENIYVKISDTGSGIPKEVLPRIFDPFFSTKKSTGLGLSISYNIIKHHGGDIKIESKIGEGSTFIIHLPKRVDTKQAV
ncbi:MAG: ATP-binding protein [Candidatus Omnitrophota bacterium]